MGRWLIGSGAAVVAVFAAFATSAATASPHVAGVTIKVTDAGQTYVINKSVTDRMYFSPGSTSVKRGGLLTFTYGGMPEDEPHTLSVVAREDLPTSKAQIDACSENRSKVCNAIAAGLVKNPNAVPTPKDVKHWIVDKGQAGLDGPGDTLLIWGTGHRSASIKVTAPAGTTLYFFCAAHPWMHGKLVVR